VAVCIEQLRSRSVIALDAIEEERFRSISGRFKTFRAKKGRCLVTPRCASLVCDKTKSEEGRQWSLGASSRDKLFERGYCLVTFSR
jgi:hypothetical protein